MRVMRRFCSGVRAVLGLRGAVLAFGLLGPGVVIRRVVARRGVGRVVAGVEVCVGVAALGSRGGRCGRSRRRCRRPARRSSRRSWRPARAPHRTAGRRGACSGAGPVCGRLCLRGGVRRAFCLRGGGFSPMPVRKWFQLPAVRFRGNWKRRSCFFASRLCCF